MNGDSAKAATPIRISLHSGKMPIKELNGQVTKQVQQRPQALHLLTHSGVGPVTALATECSWENRAASPMART